MVFIPVELAKENRKREYVFSESAKKQLFLTDWTEVMEREENADQTTLEGNQSRLTPFDTCSLMMG